MTQCAWLTGADSGRKMVIFTEHRDTLTYLLRKLETESKALEGKVFDVLGALFEQTPLRKLLVEAIRYGDRPLAQPLSAGDGEPG